MTGGCIELVTDTDRKCLFVLRIYQNQAARLLRMRGNGQKTKEKHQNTVHPKETRLLHYFIFLADSSEMAPALFSKKRRE